MHVVLELAIEIPSVADHDDGIEYRRIGGVVQTCQLMGEPTDTVRLAAAGGMLD